MSKCSVLLKTRIDGKISSVKYSGNYLYNSKFARLSFLGEDDGASFEFIYSVLSNGSVRIVKKGQTSYSLTLSTNESVNFSMSIGDFKLPLKAVAHKIYSEFSEKSLFLELKYQIISGAETLNNTVELTATVLG